MSFILGAFTQLFKQFKVSLKGIRAVAPLKGRMNNQGWVSLYLESFVRKGFEAKCPHFFNGTRKNRY